MEGRLTRPSNAPDMLIRVVISGRPKDKRDSEEGGKEESRKEARGKLHLGGEGNVRKCKW